MMGRRIPMVNGDEYDALTRAKKHYFWRAGDRADIKRRFRRRERVQIRKQDERDAI